MDLLETLGKSSVISITDLDQITKIQESVIKAYETAQVFRTRTEMEAAVLSDVRFPTPDAKYWQVVREQKNMFVQLVMESFQFRRLLVEIAELEQELPQRYTHERERLQIDLEEKLFLKRESESTCKDRIREILEWEDIKQSLLPQLKFSGEDVNEHQLIGYTMRWINEVLMAGDTGTPSERWNLFGQLDMGIKLCQEKGLLTKLLSNYDLKTRQYIKDNLLDIPDELLRENSTETQG